MAEFPAMPLWTDAYLADTRQLSAAEHGAYLLLLMTHWRIGEAGLPDNERELSRYACMTLDKWRKTAPTILAFFELSNGKWTQARVLDELQHARGRRAKAAAGGNAKALKTKGRHLPKQKTSRCLEPAHPEPEPEQHRKEASKDASKKRGTRLPDDWKPSQADIAFAQSRGHNGQAIDNEADRFRDYWHSVPGQRGVKLDWEATWRNWVRKEGDRPANNKAKMVSASGFEYRGSLDEIKRMASRRRDSDTEWECEKRLRQEREAQPLGSIVGKIVAGARQ